MGWIVSLSLRSRGSEEEDEDDDAESAAEGLGGRRGLEDWVRRVRRRELVERQADFIEGEAWGVVWKVGLGLSFVGPKACESPRES